MPALLEVGLVRPGLKLLKVNQLNRVHTCFQTISSRNPTQKQLVKLHHCLMPTQTASDRGAQHFAVAPALSRPSVVPDLVITPERACFNKQGKTLLLYLCPRLRYAHELFPLFRVGIGIGISSIRPGVLLLPVRCALLQHNLLSTCKEPS
jgi:hypothetical protein